MLEYSFKFILSYMYLLFELVQTSNSYAPYQFIELHYLDQDSTGDTECIALLMCIFKFSICFAQHDSTMSCA